MLNEHITPPQAAHETTSPEAAEFFAGANFLVAKLTDYCNLACTYCHQDALTGKPILMPMETFKNAVRLVLKPSQAPVVYVQFHGGEPLLASDDFFREAVAFCKEELENPNRRVEFFIQTNLTRVDPEREALLRELGIGISFSLDGPKEINDKMRGGSRRIIDNWRHMKTKGTHAGVICLIQPSNWDRMEEVVTFFANEGMNTMRFNLMVPDGRGKDVSGEAEVTTDKLFNAKATVLDFMIHTEGKSVVDITLIDAMKRFVKATGAPSTFEYQGCESFYCQAGRSLFSFNPDGKFYACDRIAEYPTWAMGNVNFAFGERELTLAKKKCSDFHHKDEWWARCEGCDAKKICEFSCSAYYVHDVDTREIECRYTKKLWSHMLERREEIMEFMSRELDTKFVDEKKPQEVDKEKQLITEIQQDAAFNDISLTRTLARNERFQLFKRNQEYFIYLFKRKRIFRVDATVAEIARFNGCLPPDMIATLLEDKVETGALGETLSNIQKHIPELLFQVERTTPSQFSALGAGSPAAPN